MISKSFGVDDIDPKGMSKLKRKFPPKSRQVKTSIFNCFFRFV